MELVLFGRGWDLLRPGNPIKVPRDAAVGIYLVPKNPFKVPLYFGAGVSFHGWDLFRPRNPIKVPCDAVVGTYLGPEIPLRYHDGLDLTNIAAEFCRL